MGSNLTIGDIARLAGVSKTTVSRVLSGSVLVKDATKIRVQQVIDENNYEPSVLARSLSTKKTNTIGVVIDELANPFFIEVAKYIEADLYNNGYLMLLCSSGWNPERERDLIKALIGRSVDGILLASTSNNSPAIDFLRSHNTPFVLFNLFDREDEYSYVCVDDFQGGCLAAQYFTMLNVAKYILLTGYDHVSLQERKKGFLGVLSKAGDTTPVCCYENVKTYQDGYDIAGRLIADNRLGQERAAIFVLNDNVAIGMLDGLIKEGIRIPQDVAVIGFDNIEMASKYRVALSSVAQPIEKMSAMATAELFRLITNSDGKPRKYLLKPALMIRESTGIM